MSEVAPNPEITALQTAFDAVDWVDQGTVADIPAIDFGADFRDFAGDIQPRYHGQAEFDARHAATREHVVVIQGRRLDLDENVARSNFRVPIVRLID